MKKKRSSQNQRGLGCEISEIASSLIDWSFVRATPPREANQASSIQEWPISGTTKVAPLLGFCAPISLTQGWFLSPLPRVDTATRTQRHQPLATPPLTPEAAAAASNVLHVRADLGAFGMTAQWKIYTPGSTSSSNPGLPQSLRLGHRKFKDIKKKDTVF